jgi:hypothetical protein
VPDGIGKLLVAAFHERRLVGKSGKLIECRPVLQSGIYFLERIGDGVGIGMCLGAGE